MQSTTPPVRKDKPQHSHQEPRESLHKSLVQAKEALLLSTDTIFSSRLSAIYHAVVSFWFGLSFFSTLLVDGGGAPGRRGNNH